MSKVRIYCEAVFIVSVAAVAMLVGDLHLRYIADDPLTFAVLGGGVVLGEMLPVKIPRRGDDEELTLSASFAMALLLLGGLGRQSCPGRRIGASGHHVAQAGVASSLQHRAVRPFDDRGVARHQGDLGIAASGRAPSVRQPPAAGDAPRRRRLLPGQRVRRGLGGRGLPAGPDPRYFRGSMSFVLITGGVVLLVAPIVLAAAAYTVVIVPLCLAPVLAMYNSVHQSARSQHEARHDALTGLPNRTAFHETITDAIEDDAVPASVLLMDLDRFKEVNDTLGPPIRRPAPHPGRRAAARASRRQATRSPAWAATSSRCCSQSGDRHEAVALAASHRRARCATRSSSTRWSSTSRPASASRCSPSTAPTSRRCCSRPTSPCTAPRRRAPTSPSTTSATTTTAPRGWR